MTIKVQIDNTVREATADEIARFEALAAAAEAQEQARLNAEAARVSARAKLAALGLTETEIAALVGA